MEARLELFPITTEVRPAGAGVEATLHIGGCDLQALAARHGTPLYLYDEASLEAAAGEYREALARRYPGASGIIFAGKAFLCLAMAQWAAARNLRIDCTGAGEIHIARRAGVPREQILVHGVNKSPGDLEMAVAAAGTIVVDNFGELERLAEMQRGRGGVRLPHLWLRLRPGLAVDTHAYRQTGQDESKFGFGLEESSGAVEMCRRRGLPLNGIHFHQGSHFHDPGPIGPALDRVLDHVAALGERHGWSPDHLCPGGGWGIPYHEAELPHPPIGAYVDFLTRRVFEGCLARDLPLPTLHVEPGRSIVARAGVALYRVGAVKQAGARRWLLLDGGMADNIRPALYGARYTALPVTEPLRPATGNVWLAGPYCESGDVLIADLPLAELAPGDLVAVPASGAYHLMMGSNYNGALRPAVLWLRRGTAHLIQRRETLEELVRRDGPWPGP